MRFSIIIPSYNQENHIRATLQNVSELKKIAGTLEIEIEILLFDNESNPAVQTIITEFISILDYVFIKKDKGQYDAINQGIAICKGDYWTWLNTDDYIDIEGFFKLAKILKSNTSIDYIYGGIQYMNNDGKPLFCNDANALTLKKLVHQNPGIYQPGSFFKTSFSQRIGLLKPYRCCFDYEYILNCLKNNGHFHCCNFTVAHFRYYHTSKTGTMIPIFIKEQLAISALYGRTVFSFLTWFSKLRLLKHKLFPRK